MHPDGKHSPTVLRKGSTEAAVVVQEDQQAHVGIVLLILAFNDVFISFLSLF